MHVIGADKRIISMGSEIFVTAFRLQGIEGFITSAHDFERILDIVLKDESIAIVFLEQELYFVNQEKMDDLKTKLQRPLFIEIPIDSRKKNKDIVGELIRKDIGIQLE
ncbi:hypothetical protein GF325_06500 [Candidatus Bathyarchaeota archaeon]|nr:hypothetical protein [Candidatus Bathyarchaeota archaeon]